MIYIYAFFAIVLFSCITSRRGGRAVAFMMFLFMTLFAVFRFGIGTDYFAYYHLYSCIPDLKGLANFNYLHAYGSVEPAYFIFEVLARTLKVSFVQYMGFCAVFAMFFFYKAFRKISLAPAYSFFILFANYYLVYVFSTTRQCMAISVALYAFAVLVKDRKLFKFLILSVLAVGFHYSAVVCFAVPVIIKLEKKYFLNYFWNVFFMIGFSFLSVLMPYIASHSKYTYYTVSSFNIAGFSLRIVLLVLFQLFVHVSRKKMTDEEINMGKILVFGVYLSCACMNIIVLTRLSEYFIAAECIVFANLLYRCTRADRKIFIPVMLCLYSFLFFKDVKSLAELAGYSKFRKITEFPYVTVWNKEDLLEFRNDNLTMYYFWDRGYK